MSLENRGAREMERFFERGMELVVQGTENVDLGFRRATAGANTFEEYSVVIGGQEYRVSYEGRRGLRYQITVAFTPGAQDNLRFISGADYQLPTFTVSREKGKFAGTLEFCRYNVERKHWWSRLEDFLTRPDTHTGEIQNFVGVKRDADKVLRSLNRRLAHKPSSITAVNPDQWYTTALKHSNF